jgi:hypothetical protein
MATVDFFVNTENASDGNGLTRADTGTYWALSFDSGSTDPTGSTIEVNGATSNNGYVEKVILDGVGSWGAGTAAGIMILSSKNGTFSDPQQLDINGGATNIADVHITGTSTNFWDNRNEDAGAYNQLIDWETALAAYTDMGSDGVRVHCSGTTADTSAQVDITAWGSGSPSGGTYVQADDGTPDGVAAYNNAGLNTTNSGDISTSYYRFLHTASSDALWHRLNNARVLGIQLEKTTNAGAAIYFTGGSNGHAGGLRVKQGTNQNGIQIAAATHVYNCYIQGTTSAAGKWGVYCASSAAITDIVNNVFIDWDGTTAGGLNSSDYSPTITNLENNVFRNNTSDVSLGTVTNTNTNAADADINSDTGTIHPTWTAGVHFVDIDNHDARPTTSDSPSAPFANGTATNLPDTDINGVDRGDGTYNSPDIGPFHLANPVIYCNRDNVGTEDGSSVATGHNTFSEAETATQTQCPDLPADGRQSVTIQCSGTTADLAGSVAGFTIDADPYRLYVIGDNNTPGYSTSHFRFEDTGIIGNWSQDRMTARYIQAYRTANSGIAFQASEATGTQYEGCYFRAAVSATNGVVYGTGTSTGRSFYNCIFDLTSASATSHAVMRDASTNGASHYNCLFICGGATLPRGIRHGSNFSTDLKNTVFCNIGDELNGLWTNATIEYCRGLDSDFSSGTGNANWTLTTDDYDKYYPNYASKDFTPVYSDSTTGVYAQGESGASTSMLSVDFRGTSRGDNTSANFVGDIGPVHLRNPVAYVTVGASGDGDGRDYTNGETSLFDCEVAMQGDWTVNNREGFIKCATSSGSADTTAAVFTGWTLNENNYTLTVQGNDDGGVTDGRNTGTSYSALHYRMECTTSASNIRVVERGIKILGLQFKHDTTAGYCLELDSAWGTVDGCFVDQNTDSHAVVFGNTSFGCYNSYIDSAATTSTNACIFIEANTTTDVYNNCLNNPSGTGLHVDGTLTNFYNNIIVDCTDDVLVDGTVSSSGNNIGDSGEATIGTAYDVKYWGDGVTFSIVPLYSDAAASPYANGTTTSLPSTDIRGTSRGTSPSAPDIGPYHLDAPTAYVNLDGSGGDQDGRNHANGETSLSNAETAAQTSLVENNRSMTITCGCDDTTFADPSGQVDFNGWGTTGASNKIVVKGNSAEAGVNTGNSFDSTTRFYLYYTADTNGSSAIEISGTTMHIDIEDLQVWRVSGATGDNLRGVRFNADSNTGVSSIKRCWIKGTGSTTGTQGALLDCGFQKTGTLTVQSCVIHSASGSSWEGVYAGALASIEQGIFENCTIRFDGSNYALSADSGDAELYNCAIYHFDESTGVCISGSAATMTTCATTDATGSATLQERAAATDFNAPGSDDYRPLDTGVLDTSGTYDNTGYTDITGTTFTDKGTSEFTIGAFNEVVAAGGGSSFKPYVIFYNSEEIDHRSLLDGESPQGDALAHLGPPDQAARLPLRRRAGRLQGAQRALPSGAEPRPQHVRRGHMGAKPGSG